MKHDWHFPLPRPHTGVVLGNGVQGLMVWGERMLNLTVARAGFWDHRGANTVLDQVTFAETRRLLEADDAAGLDARFGRGHPEPFPRQYGGGRMELRFEEGWRPWRARLDLKRARLEIELRNARGRRAVLVVRQAVEAEVAWIQGPPALLRRMRVRLVPTWTHLRAHFERMGIAPPRRWSGAAGGGFEQALPEDDPLAVAWARRPDGAIVLATALGHGAARRARESAAAADVERLGRAAERWWRRYWRDVPRVRLPDGDAALQRVYEYGLFKQAGMTPPHGPAATLQGPWMEDYQPPPWSNDYHFNINVQLVYSPCFATNRLDHLRPLWALIASWAERMRQQGERFYGAPGAWLLPHAVDDRGQVVGTFWSGTIDQACAAWMGQLAWRHYRHAMDEHILREVAWPLLNGAFNGYWAMLETVESDGRRRLTLPVSVSPEFTTGSTRGTWGRDASFQLAALHMLATLLPRAAAVLGEPEDSRWARVRTELPPYALAEGKRIALWEGQDLTFSHRHHSHLAGIWPFETIDPFDPRHGAVVGQSLLHWSAMGAGGWTGWCVPWASMICARCGLGDAALLWLRWWQYLFTNAGGASLHNADFAGCASRHNGALYFLGLRKPETPNDEVMQMDAALAAVTAILELLVQQRGDAVHIVPGLPKAWRDFDFDGIRVEGAFLIGATVREGRVVEVRVRSLVGGLIRLAHGLRAPWRVNRGRKRSGALWRARTQVGARYVLTLAD